MAAGSAPIMTDAADGGRNGMSSTGLMRAASGELHMPATLRWYLAHERAILGTLVVMLFLIGWEGLERGWWADALHPLLGTSAERLRLKPIFISAGDWRLFRTIILPSSVPFLLAGLRLAIGRGMIGVVVGEIYGSAAGVGAMINQAGARFQTDKVFVGVLTIVAVGVILVEIVQRIERRVDVWRAPA